jgi:hypothetical protein
MLSPTCFRHLCDHDQGAVARILLKYNQIARLRNFTNMHVMVHCTSVNICLIHEIKTHYKYVSAFLTLLYDKQIKSFLCSIVQSPTCTTIFFPHNLKTAWFEGKKLLNIQFALIFPFARNIYHPNNFLDRFLINKVSWKSVIWEQSCSMWTDRWTLHSWQLLFTIQTCHIMNFLTNFFKLLKILLLYAQYIYSLLMFVINNRNLFWFVLSTNKE